MKSHLSRSLLLLVVLGVLLLLPGGAAAQTTLKYEIVHRFTGGSPEGGYPYGTLIQGNDGSLYGVLRWGPTLVFRLTLDGSITSLHNQTGEAYEPFAGVVQGADGAFYGTTAEGNAAGGTVFRVTSAGEFTVLHEFTAAFGSVTTDGGHPAAALIQARDGMLYGTTRYGGTGGAGVIFRITPGGVYETLRSFPSQTGPPDIWPSGPVVQTADSDDLYGTMKSGGAYGFGAIFTTTIANPDPNSTPVILHDFRSGPDDGGYPNAGLLPAADGGFYGTTYLGGPWNGGTIFKVTRSGVVTILHYFRGGADDGAAPMGGVVLARDGNFYGSTHDGGLYNLGVVYRMTPSGEITVLHSFARGSDGASPYEGLVEAGDGTLYGMTAGGGGGYIGSGTVYRIRFVPPPVPIVGFDADAKADMPLYDATTGTWRILTSSSEYRSSLQISWGGPEYTPVPADYDGDGRLDIAVYHAGRGIWYVLTSSSHFTSVIMKTLGGVGYAPAPGDFDGDRRADPAVYRRATGQWTILQSSDQSTQTLTIGSGGVPIRGDFDGDFIADPAIYLPATGAWRVLTSRSGFSSAMTATLGGTGFAPVPGDFDGDHKTDIAVYHGATGEWKVLQSSSNFTTILTQGWGGTGYAPVPGDYDADGKTDLAVYAADAGTWYVLESGTGFTTTLHAEWGTPLDTVVTSLPVRTAWTDALRATDFDGDGASDVVVYEPATGVWTILTSSSHFTQTRSITWGGAYGDIPVPGDYDGDGLTDPAVFNPATGTWGIQRSTRGPLTVTLGTWEEIPVPGDYDGDGTTDPAMFTPWSAVWQMRWSTWSASFDSPRTIAYGAAWWTPATGDYDGDGRTDLGLYDMARGWWAALLTATNYASQLTMVWGGPGHTAVPGDYDGDGLDDIAACRTARGKWSVLKSGFVYSTAFGVAWGAPIDTAVTGDYDGDGLGDMASYEATTGEWYLRLSSTNYTLTLARTLGGPGFIPAR